MEYHILQITLSNNEECELYRGTEENCIALRQLILSNIIATNDNRNAVVNHITFYEQR